MKNKGQLFFILAGLIVLLFSYNHCGMPLGKKINKKAKEASPTSLPTGTAAVPDDHGELPVPALDLSENTNPVVQAQVSVGIKSFMQVRETMSVLTGVSSQDSNVENTFEEVKSQLPTNNNIKTFISANQVAIAKMGTVFCDELVDSTSLRGNIWPGVNFGQTPNQVWNSAGKISFVNQTLTIFWGSNVIESEQFVASSNILLDLMDDLLDGENLDSSTTTRTVAKGVCIAAISSAPVTML